MGVPLLLTWLRKRFADCFLPADSAVTDYIRAGTDNLYIDLNSFLYQAATIIAATHRSHRFASADEVEDVVLRKLFDLLDDLVLSLVQPKALVYIAVDGVSPLGKMSQQRARRRRGARKSPGPPSSSPRHHESSGNISDLWDGNCISVGTRFMAKVTEALHFYAVSRTERINAKRLREAMARLDNATTEADAPTAQAFPALNITVDDVLRPGEGENKIAEFIRRIRADPGYGPNTAHVICSSDTDVTVTCLILHEPRIHVLRYEPPVALGGKPPQQPQQHHHHSQPMSRPPFAHRGGGPAPHGPRRFAHHRGPPARGGYRGGHHDGGRGGGGSGPRPSPPPPKDSWLSTFFSIHVFRQRLREILLLASEDGTSALAEEEAVLVFEHTLHDVVFVLLLFGNDFLPTIGGSIQEGTLDALLSLLATDFVPRGQTLVDPATNHIQYASARYLLSRLAELPANKKGGGGGRLQVHNGGGGGGDAMDWGFTVEKEAKERDAAFLARQQRREKQHERMCYCYWTMLQWALQYSAGIVEHWGCYYPYGRAPPLSKLATYCGVLSYDALGEIARRRLEAGAMTARRGDAAAPVDDEDEEEEDGMDGLPTSALTAKSVDDAVERGRPTDVMVQLLILIPARSVALLPTVFRHHYREMEAAVQAPVEQLNLASIGAWCEEKKRSLSEEERTRFTAYQFFASDTNLGTEKTPFPAHDIAFSAYWDPAEVDAELVAHRSDRLRLTSTSNHGGSGSDACIAPALQSKAASFFSLGRRPVPCAKGPTAAASSLLMPSAVAGTSGGGGSGAAALLAGVDLTAGRASPPPSPETPLQTTAAAAVGEEASATGDSTPPPASPLMAAAAAAAACRVAAPSHPPTQLLHPKGDYVLWVARCEALKDPLLVRALGTIQGNRFSVGSYSPLVDQDAVLSRSTYARQDVRLQFRLAVVPLITDLTYGARLMPGYVEPVEVGMQERILAARKEEADRADPWRQMDKLQTMRAEHKRERGESDAEEPEGEVEEVGEKSAAAATAATTAAEKKEGEVEAADSEETVAVVVEPVQEEAVTAAPLVVDSEAAELQQRKEGARRRLAALKAARLAAQEEE